MKEIKIRYIEHLNTDNKQFTIQRKGLFRWKDITYTIDMGYGSIVYNYHSESEEKLLEEVLEKYYEVDKRFVKIKEYPKIKIY